MNKLNIYDVMKLFMVKEDEESLETQRVYKNYLDKIIDALIVLKYKNGKKNYEFYTLNQLDDYIQNHLGGTQIDKLAEMIAYYTQKRERIPYYFQRLEKIYLYYRRGDLTKEVTTKFYNEILNDQQNSYYSKEKKVLRTRLKLDLPLADRKKQNLENGIRLQIALKILEKEGYQGLDIKESDLLSDLNKLHSRISYVKELKKVYLLSEQDYEYFDDLFLKNELNDENLKLKYPFFSKKQRNIIRNKYNQILLPYLEEMPITNETIQRINVGFHENHLKFYDASIHYANVVAFLDSLTYSELDTIVGQYEKVKNLFRLLPLVDLVPGLEMKVLKDMILYYPKIEETLISRGEISSNLSIDWMLKRLPSMIRLSKVYSRTDCYTYAILGESNLEKILESDSRINDLSSYIKIYGDMLKRDKNTIPPLGGEFGDFVYESGTAERTRLLLGCNCYGSCITPDYGETFNHVLTEQNADVLMINDKNTNQFVARALLFRRDNFIVIAPIYGENGKENKHFYNKEFLTQISNQLLSTAKEKGDSLDYVFLANNNIGKKKQVDFPVIMHSILKKSFPHADLNYNDYLIGYSENVIKKGKEIEFVPLKETLDLKPLYPSKRLDVQRKTENYQEDIARIKALEIISTKNQKQQESFKKQYASLLETTFSEVYSGQDWYIALKDNKILSKGIFEVSDSRQQEEMKVVESSLLKILPKENPKREKVFCLQKRRK